MDSPILFGTSLGEAGSGRVRYAAAMALYRDGNISAEQLEVFRIASADDALHPHHLLLQRGMNLPNIERTSPEAALRALVDAVDMYFAKHPGPGVAEVRAGMARFRDVPYTATTATENKVVQAHLQTALQAVDKSEPLLANLLALNAPLLSWVTYDLYDRAKIGESFATSHAFCTIIGETGPIKARDFDLGLFLIAPHVLYRDHCHAAPELYAPLTGPHGWRFKPNAPLVNKDAHDFVWNEPNAPHLTKVGAIPFFCIYGWTRDTDKPARVLPADDWAELEALRL